MTVSKENTRNQEGKNSLFGVWLVELTDTASLLIVPLAVLVINVVVLKTDCCCCSTFSVVAVVVVVVVTSVLEADDFSSEIRFSSDPEVLLWIIQRNIKTKNKNK
jgi:membrane protein YdbS with pleckstrin-like domain